MEFFGLEIKPGKPVNYGIQPGKTLRITQASLGETVQEGGRSVLTINIGGQKHVIAILLPGKFEHTVMDLIFEEQKLEFSVSGKNSIHLAGNLMESDDDEDDEDEDAEDDDELDTAPPSKKGKQAMMMDGDDDDDEEDDDDEDDGDDDEEDEPASKKRPPSSPATTPANKQQKTGANPATASAKKDATPAAKGAAPNAAAVKKDTPPAKPAGTPAAKPGTPAAKAATPAAKPTTPVVAKKDPAAKSPGTPTTPGTPGKPFPADIKEKVREVLKEAKDNTLKAGDFPREFQKKHGKSFKEVYEGLGYKKLTESLKSMGDVVTVEADNVKLKKK